MTSNSHKNKIKFFFEKKIKVRIFIQNFKYEGYISELIDESQFGFNDLMKGEDVFEYENVKTLYKIYD